MQRRTVDHAPVTLPRYMPPDAVALTSYQDVLEVLRSANLRPEPGTDENAPISSGVLTRTHGPDHTRRRRIMNRLVRPASLEHYRDVLLIPALKAKLRELSAHPDSNGSYRADLVQFTMLPFVRFAAALAGFDLSEPGRDEHLLRLVNAMGAQHRINWYTDDHRGYIERGLRAKAEFKEHYFEPALAACPFEPGSEVPAERHDLISLVCAELDPAWQDEDLKLRDTFTSVFAAGVGSSATMMTNALDELSRWLPAHPEDNDRLDDLTFLSVVLQETLRLNPTPPAFGRIADEDLILASGREIKAGQWVACLPTTANRDSSVYGQDADSFDPRRVVPSGVPRYGVSFGAGSHQCLGLRVVLGNDGIGSHAYVLRLLLAAGVQRDPSDPPAREPSERMNWARYPVVFTTLERVVGAQDP